MRGAERRREEVRGGERRGEGWLFMLCTGLEKRAERVERICRGEGREPDLETKLKRQACLKRRTLVSFQHCILLFTQYCTYNQHIISKRYLFVRGNLYFIDQKIQRRKCPSPLLFSIASPAPSCMHASTHGMIPFYILSSISLITCGYTLLNHTPLSLFTIITTHQSSLPYTSIQTH